MNKLIQKIPPDLVSLYFADEKVKKDMIKDNVFWISGPPGTGKTSFIKALLGGQEYPGMHIAAEMSTDNFIAVMRGQADDIIPGSLKYHATC